MGGAQPVNPGSPGKMDVKTECVYVIGYWLVVRFFSL